MSLFVGNIARDVNDRALEEEFDRISACEFKFKVRPRPPDSTVRFLTNCMILGQLRLRGVQR